MKNIFIICIVALLLAGCAGPGGIAGYPPMHYRVEAPSVGYVPITTLAQEYKLEWGWEPVIQVASLSGPGLDIKVRVGSDVAVVNYEVEQLSHPVELHNGVVSIPASFVSKRLDKLAFPVRPKRVPPPEIVEAYRINTVVIDPGHGGKDPGAVGRGGLREKDVTLDISKRLKNLLEKEDIKVILTRSSDRFISLWRRAQIANKQDADLFISVHANASRHKSARGFEAFYLSDAVDDAARALEEVENESLRYERASSSKSPLYLQAMLWDIIYSENRGESRKLAECITDSTCNGLGVRNRGVKSAKFYVLKGAKMPAVLVEVGFISNIDEANKLMDRFYRQDLAQSLAGGILAYREEYQQTYKFADR